MINKKIAQIKTEIENSIMENKDNIQDEINIIKAVNKRKVIELAYQTARDEFVKLLNERMFKLKELTHNAKEDIETLNQYYARINELKGLKEKLGAGK